MDWSILHPKVFEEFVHRFRPKAVVLATASCPSILTCVLENQIPTLAICFLDEQLFKVMMSMTDCHWPTVIDSLGFFQNNQSDCHASMTQGYSAKHETWYQDNASKTLFKMMCQAKSRHYQPELAKAIKDTKKNDEEAEGQPAPKKKPRGGGSSSALKKKRKSRGKGKKGRGKGKAPKKRKANDDDEEDGGLLEEDEEDDKFQTIEGS